MHFRLKLLLANTALALVSAGIVFALVYRAAASAQFEQIQATVKAIAVSAAGSVDGELHELIRDGDGTEALAVEVTLRRARDLQRAAGVEVAFIYTMRPGPDGEWIFVVDAEEDGTMKSAYGDPYVFDARDEQDLLLELEAPAKADRDFTSDQYGYWLSAAAPVRDGSGKAVARLGVDLRADDVIAKQRGLLGAALCGLVTALIAGIALALLVGTWASGPLHRIGVALGKIGDGKLDTRLKVQRRDEFGRLEESVNTMAESLAHRRALKSSLARYVSRDVAQDLVKLGGEQEFEADAEERNISVLFCNIDDLEKLDTILGDEEVVRVLNVFFSRTVSAIFGNGGTLDRYFGAGVMATFGADDGGGEHARRALLAAKAIVAAMAEVSSQTSEEVELEVRIGVHTGDASVARSDDSHGGRMAFKAAGGAVDTASRIMAEACRQGKAILASSASMAGAGEGFETRLAGDIDADGKRIDLVSIE